MFEVNRKHSNLLVQVIGSKAIKMRNTLLWRSSKSFLIKNRIFTYDFLLSPIFLSIFIYQQRMSVGIRGISYPAAYQITPGFLCPCQMSRRGEMTRGLSTRRDTISDRRRCPETSLSRAFTPHRTEFCGERPNAKQTRGFPRESETWTLQLDFPAWWLLTVRPASTPCVGCSVVCRAPLRPAP